MRCFIDCEFLERGAGHPIDLISIGIVAEDGRSYYAENSDCDLSATSDWVRTNVVPHLNARRWVRPRDAIARDLVAFVAARPGAPEFWGYFSAFDWVVLCQIFGDMSMLPAGWPCSCRDLRQALDERGLAGVKQPDDAPHHALADARWVAETWRRHIAEGGEVMPGSSGAGPGEETNDG